MKNLLKKITSFFLFALLITTVISSQPASARGTSSSTWGISISQVGTGVPYYSTYAPTNMVIARSGNTYNLSSNCAIVQFKYTSGCDTWVWVDGINNTSYRLLKFSSSGSDYLNTVAIPNLTPGTHSIQVRASSPDYMSTAIKYQSVNVVIPKTTTSSAVALN